MTSLINTHSDAPWRDRDLPVHDRVEALPAAMTPEEKVAQLGSVRLDQDGGGDAAESAPMPEVFTTSASGDVEDLVRGGIGHLTRVFGTAPVIDEPNPNPSTLPDGSTTDRAPEQNVRTGTKTLLSVPLPGWVAKGRGKACGFSVAEYGPQQSTDPWTPDCGNGVKPDGSHITGTDPHDTSVEADRRYVTDFVNHLKAKYGTAEQGGVKYYNLDNEYDLWQHTHRDVRKQGAGAVEIRDRTYDIVAAVKAADPGAKTLGPVGWGYRSLFHSGLGEGDRPHHGNVDIGEWYPAQMRAYQQQHGVRILDYFDVHLYPQRNGGAGEPGDEATRQWRLRSTRQLWDPTYTDESWINDEIRFIPRMKEMVVRDYPGTKVAMTEYSRGAYDHVNGALTQVDVLGVFGREGLDMASLWTAPRTDQPIANAFRSYRNHDGVAGGSVMCASAPPVPIRRRWRSTAPSARRTARRP